MKNIITSANKEWFSRKKTFSYYQSSKDDLFRLKTVISMIQKHSRNGVDLSSQKLLDVGCGDGKVSQQIQKLTGLRVFGIDISLKNIVLCRKKGISAKCGSIEKSFPYESASFDFVFAGEIIEHIFDTKAFLNEINRILKPGGILIITTPNLAHLPDRIRFLFGKNPTNVSPIHPFLHLHIRPFTFNMLEYALNLTGYKVLTLKSTLVVFKWHADKVVLASRLLAILVPTFGNTFIVESQKK